MMSRHRIARGAGTLAAARQDVGADEAADATCAGDDGVPTSCIRPARIETVSPNVGALPFTRRVERYLGLLVHVAVPEGGLRDTTTRCRLTPGGEPASRQEQNVGRAALHLQGWSDELGIVLLSDHIPGQPTELLKGALRPSRDKRGEHPSRLTAEGLDSVNGSTRNEDQRSR
jgi:hypothetical protein